MRTFIKTTILTIIFSMNMFIFASAEDIEVEGIEHSYVLIYLAIFILILMVVLKGKKIK